MIPDRWVVVKITSPNKKYHYRVFASWYGGYLSSDSWQMNSGIVSVDEENDHLNFNGASGSIYSCNKNCYGTTTWGYNALKSYVNDAASAGASIEILNESTDWKNIDYSAGR